MLQTRFNVRHVCLVLTMLSSNTINILGKREAILLFHNFIFDSITFRGEKMSGFSTSRQPRIIDNHTATRQATQKLDCPANLNISNTTSFITVTCKQTFNHQVYLVRNEMCAPIHRICKAASK